MLSFGLFWFDAFSLISVDGKDTLIFEVYFKNVNESNLGLGSFQWLHLKLHLEG